MNSESFTYHCFSVNSTEGFENKEIGSPKKPGKF